MDDRIALALISIDEALRLTTTGRSIFSEQEVQDLLLDIRASLVPATEEVT